MAAKGYMTDFEALKETFESGGTPEWILYRGFVTSLRDRAIRVGEQKSKDVSLEDSFDDLKKRIHWNSGGGGDFTVFIPTKASNQGETIWFRVEGAGTQQPGVAGLGGFGNLPMPASMYGLMTKDDLDKERRMWELERKNEELEDAISGPSQWWQTLLQGFIEDGTVKEVIGAVKEIGVAMLRNKAQVGAPPLRPTATLSGVPVAPPQPTATPEEAFEYDDTAFDFLDTVRVQFGDDLPRFYAFLTKMQQVFANNPQMWVNLVEQQSQ